MEEHRLAGALRVGRANLVLDVQLFEHGIGQLTAGAHHRALLALGEHRVGWVVAALARRRDMLL